MRRVALATVLLLASSLPLAAQQAQHQHRHGGGHAEQALDATGDTQAMEGMRGMACMRGAEGGMATRASAPCPCKLLKLRAELSLDDAQVEALEALKARTHPEHMALEESAAAAKTRAETALEGEPDMAGYETALMEAAQAEVAGKLLMARAGVEGLDLLDDDQRAALPELLAASGGMRCMKGGHGGMEDAGHGAH